MEQLARLFDSDALPVGILGLIAFEATALLWFQRRNPSSPLGSPNAARVVSFLGAGGSLVTAMVYHRREVPSPEGFALAMLAALVFHLWHIAVLLRR